MQTQMKAFMVPATAVRTSNTRGVTVIEVGTRCEIYIAADEAQARATGEEKARKAWPESDGWLSHTVSVFALTRENAIEILKCFPDLGTGSDPDWVM